MRLVALAGGVGAARFLRGLVRVVEPADLTVIVNTGDDREFYGVHVSPDLDIVTYTLAGRVDPEKGYGLEGDRFSVVDTLADLGHETWFRLGDRDLATALHRSLRLREGAGLAEITNEICCAYGVDVRVLPMTEDPAPTFVELSDGSRVHFEEYLARDGAPDDVSGVDLAAAAAAQPAPGVLETIDDAELILICPSNPVVSIGPILTTSGVRSAVVESKAPVIGISPIIGGAPVKGPADKLLRGIGVEVSARGVARHYAEVMDGIVIDERDTAQRADVEALGMNCDVTETLMRTPEVAASLAQTALDVGALVRGTR